jgi:Mor family transcriptional regulator
MLRCDPKEKQRKNFPPNLCPICDIILAGLAPLHFFQELAKAIGLKDYATVAMGGRCYLIPFGR